MKQRLKRLLKEMEFRWEYYIMYFMFHPHKRGVYHTFMRRKWGTNIAPVKSWRSTSGPSTPVIPNYDWPLR